MVGVLRPSSKRVRWVQSACRGASLHKKAWTLHMNQQRFVNHGRIGIWLKTSCAVLEESSPQWQCDGQVGQFFFAMTYAWGLRFAKNKGGSFAFWWNQAFLALVARMISGSATRRIKINDETCAIVCLTRYKVAIMPFVKPLKMAMHAFKKTWFYSVDELFAW